MLSRRMITITAEYPFGLSAIVNLGNVVWTKAVVLLAIPTPNAQEIMIFQRHGFLKQFDNLRQVCQMGTALYTGTYLFWLS